MLMPLPLCETQHKTQLLASVYRTFLLAKLSNFVTRMGPSTHVINATSFVYVSAREKRRKPSATFLAIKRCPKRVGSFGYSTDFLMRRSVRSDIDSVRKL